jgi:hypothetical protein
MRKGRNHSWCLFMASSNQGATILTGQTSADPEKKDIRDEEAGDARDQAPLPTCSDVNESRPMYVNVRSAINPGTILGII